MEYIVLMSTCLPKPGKSTFGTCWRAMLHRPDQGPATGWPERPQASAEFTQQCCWLLYLYTVSVSTKREASFWGGCHSVVLTYLQRMTEAISHAGQHVETRMTVTACRVTDANNITCSCLQPPDIACTCRMHHLKLVILRQRTVNRRISYG